MHLFHRCQALFAPSVDIKKEPLQQLLIKYETNQPTRLKV